MNKQLFYFVIPLCLALGLAYFLVQKEDSTTKDTSINILAAAAKVEGNTQVLEIQSKYGYFPSHMTAKSGLPTTLKITTENSFDCGNAFTIPELGITKSLPPTGVTEVTIPPQPAGKKLLLACSMRMFTAEVLYE